MRKSLLITFLLLNFILGNNKVNFNAMAPLHIMRYNDSSIEQESDWNLFGIHLEEAKRIGVEAISVDAVSYTHLTLPTIE